MGRVRTSNPAFVALIAGGALAALIGLVVWILSAQALERRQLVAEFVAAGTGVELGGDAIAQAQLGVWIGIALLILGVLMLLAALIIRAARPSAPAAVTE